MSFPVVFDKPSDFTVQMECVDLFNAGYSENFVISHSYNDLSDKPKLNGQTIQGDIDEIDPTVPEWAKSPKKTAYNAEEIGALSKSDIQIVTAADFENMWNEN